MRDKIRIELSSENRLGWEPFYAVLDLPATAQQIKDARQKARITGREDMTYQEISFLGFDPLPDLEHLRLDTTTVEELNYLAQRLDALSDEQFIIYQALFDQRFGDVDSDELLSVKDLINMTYGLDSVMVASNIHNDEQLGQFVIENDLHPDVAAIPDNSLYLLDKRRIGELQRKNEGGVTAVIVCALLISLTGCVADKTAPTLQHTAAIPCVSCVLLLAISKTRLSIP